MLHKLTAQKSHLFLSASKVQREIFAKLDRCVKNLEEGWFASTPVNRDGLEMPLRM